MANMYASLLLSIPCCMQRASVLGPVGKIRDFWGVIWGIWDVHLAFLIRVS